MSVPPLRRGSRGIGDRGRNRPLRPRSSPALLVGVEADTHDVAGGAGQKDALRLVNNLIQATTPKGSHESDPFWTKAETALLQAIILMLWQEAPEDEQTTLSGFSRSMDWKSRSRGETYSSSSSLTSAYSSTRMTMEKLTASRPSA